MQALKMFVSCKLIGDLLFGLIVIQLIVLCDARRISHFRNRTTSRIVDGEEVKDYEYPEHVIMMINHPEGMELCGGVTLKSNLVLTAAHCVKRHVKNPSNILVNNIQFEPLSWKPDDIAQAAKVEKICISNKYWFGSDKEYNDFAILRLETALYNYFEGKLADKETNFGAKVEAVGIGYTHIDLKNPANNQRAERLRKLAMQRVECYEYDQDLSHVCFESKFGGDTCYGDSGSPVFNEFQEVVALTSYGDDKDPCRHKPFKARGVYADVARNRKLIDGLIRDCTKK